MKEGIIMRKKRRIDYVRVMISIVMGIWALVILFPFYNALLASITTQKEYARNPLMLFPKEPTF